METTAELKAMNGKAGNEELVFCENAYYSQSQWDSEMKELESVHPKTAKKLRKQAVIHVHTWTWEFGYTRQGVAALYRTNERYAPK